MGKLSAADNTRFNRLICVTPKDRFNSPHINLSRRYHIFQWHFTCYDQYSRNYHKPTKLPGYFTYNGPSSHESRGGITVLVSRECKVEFAL
ncbi:hypothetical protein E2C01_082596 [Portunus trituberculatus]|uniref:Uncharacterized protein n=1 Tax=Portunus trituberculatus TaxID=210409 RepID=A0A5B7J5K0_PORTR|nr:hypothetical protein [Portunus trituberculatus]